MQWIFGERDQRALILWLYGSASTGKSTVLLSAAERCAELDILLASFFFCSRDITRNHPYALVPTVAYQIATRIPHVAAALNSIISHDPMIFDKSLDTQILHLIVNPLKSLVTTGFFNSLETVPRLVIIDGLDECQGTGLRNHLLLFICRALQEHSIPLRFLISSRPSEEIYITLNSRPLVDLWMPLVLDCQAIRPLDIYLLFPHTSKTLHRATTRRFLPQIISSNDHVPVVHKCVRVVGTVIILASLTYAFRQHNTTAAILALVAIVSLVRGYGSQGGEHMSRLQRLVILKSISSSLMGSVESMIFDFHI